MDIHARSLESLAAMDRTAGEQLGKLKGLDRNINKVCAGKINTVTESSKQFATHSLGTASPAQKKAFENWKAEHQTILQKQRTLSEKVSSSDSSLKAATKKVEKSCKKIAEVLENPSRGLFRGKLTLREQVEVAGAKTKKIERALGGNVKGGLVKQRENLNLASEKLAGRAERAWKTCQRQVDLLGKLDATKDEITRDLGKHTKGMKQENYKLIEAPLAKLEAIQAHLDKLEADVKENPKLLPTEASAQRLGKELRLLRNQAQDQLNQIRDILQFQPVASRVSRCFTNLFGGARQKVEDRRAALLGEMTGELTLETKGKLLESSMKTHKEETIQDTKATLSKLLAKLEINPGDRDSIEKLDKFVDVINENRELRRELYKDEPLRKSVVETYTTTTGLQVKKQEAAAKKAVAKEADVKDGDELAPPNISDKVLEAAEDLRKWSDLAGLQAEVEKTTKEVRANIPDPKGTITHIPVPPGISTQEEVKARARLNSTNRVLNEILTTEQTFVQQMETARDLLTHLRDTTKEANRTALGKDLREGLETEKMLEKCLEGLEGRDFRTLLSACQNEKAESGKPENKRGVELLKGVVQGFSSEKMNEHFEGIKLGAKLTADKTALLGEHAANLEKLQEKHEADPKVQNALKGQSLSAFLSSVFIQPVQRAPRYKLLLTELGDSVGKIGKGLECTPEERASVGTAVKGCLDIARYNAAMINIEAPQ